MPGRPTHDDTLALRLDRYDYAMQRCTYIGGGIGGLFVLIGLNANSIVNASLTLRGWVITLALLAGAAIGRAYIGYSTAKQNTSAEQMLNHYPDEMNADEVLRYPNSTYWWYVIAILLFLADAFLVMVGAWAPPAATALFISLLI
jgi:hypothetical protein